MSTRLLIVGVSVLCIFLLARFVTWAEKRRTEKRPVSDTPQAPAVENFFTRWEKTYRTPLRGLAALVIAIYFTIVLNGPEKSWTLLKQSWPVLLIIGYYAAVYLLLPLLGFFIGLYIIVPFIKWAWNRK